MASLNGTWKLIAIEKFEEFMKAIDVSEENKQKGLKLLTPENDIKQEISVEGDSVCIKTVTPVSTQEHKGNIGQEFDQPGWDGRPVKARFILDGDKLVENLSGPYTASNTRYIKDGNLIMEQKCGSVTSTRTYSKS